jgi:putative transposase
VQTYDENYRCYGARKDVACAAPGRPRGSTLHGRAADAPAGPARCLSWEDQASHQVADPAAARAGDLVGRKFAPCAPNRLWVADFTYVSTMAGWVYVAFVIDAYARRILGWKASTSMTTDLVLAAIDQAIFTRKRDGVKSLAGLIHHNDAGSRYTSVRFTDRLIAEGINPSIGTVGDAHDNSLAESINGLYKTELIKPRRPWRNAAHVSAETATYVDWFNNRRLYEYCGDLPPAKLEEIYYCNHQGNEIA